MPSHRRIPQPGFPRTSHATLLSAAAATLAALSGTTCAPAALADPRDPAADPFDAASRIDRLHEEAEKATEQYNGARERSMTLRDEIGELQDRSARDQERANRLRDTLGTVAGAQYREGGVDPAVALMLSSDPDSYLGRAEALDRLSSRQAAGIREFQRIRRDLAQRRAEAAAKLAELEKVRATLNERKRAVQGKLAEARRLVNLLSSGDRAGFAAGDRASRSGRTLSVLPGPGPSSGRAAAALAAVQDAVGAPYVWGSAGPAAFDCSGLMVWAYQQAGVALPRTSQGQLHAGQRVPLDQARPGDLVVYRDDASHVGMYVGGGQVVHAPYPGARVRYDPVGMMPVAGITRL